MRIPPLLIALMVALLATPTVHAQTPSATPAPGTLMQLTVDRLAPDGTALIGVTRVTYEATGSMQVITGSGPTISFVESGAITVDVIEGEPAVVTGAAGTAPGIATPAGAEAGTTVVVEAGSGFLLRSGTTATIRNDGPDPAVVLDVVAATDAVAEPGDGVTLTVVMSATKTLPETPVTVTLDRVTVGPGDRLDLPPEPAVVIYTAVEKEQVFLITGNGFNRSNEAVDAYVLVIAPA